MAFSHLGRADLDDLACQSADDALVSILRRLSDFRGDSRFTTWACKFAILEAGVKVRRHAWRGREIPLTPASWPVVADMGNESGVWAWFQNDVLAPGPHTITVKARDAAGHWSAPSNADVVTGYAC